MYNESQKQEYLAQRSHFSKGSLENIERMFKRIAKYEEEAGCDFCYITDRETVLKIMSEFGGFRISALKSKLTILRAYTNWCKNEKKLENVSDVIHSITEEDVNLEYIKIHMVGNPTDLQDCMNKIFDREDDKTVDNTLRCFLWMAFIGIDEQNTVYIKNDDVDMVHQSISYHGHDYPFPGEAMAAIKNCMYLKEFNIINRHYVNTGYGKKDRCTGAELLRRSPYNTTNRTYEPDQDLSRIMAYVAMKMKKKAPERPLTYFYVQLSGYFYRIYQRERFEVKIDFEDLARKIADEREYDKESDRYNILLRKTCRELTSEYNRWKRAFY